MGARSVAGDGTATIGPRQLSSMRIRHRCGDAWHTPCAARLAHVLWRDGACAPGAHRYVSRRRSLLTRATRILGVRRLLASGAQLAARYGPPSRKGGRIHAAWVTGAWRPRALDADGRAGDGEGQGIDKLR